MKKFFQLIIFCLCILFLPFRMALAINFPSLPSKDQFIVDKTNTLTITDKEKINAIAIQLWQTKKVPIITVIISSLADMDADNISIEQYTQDLFTFWQLGLKQKNYGVVLLVSLKDRKARIEFGKDYDHRYDSDAKEIMQNYIVPRFKEGRYGDGIIDGVSALDKLVRGLKLPEIKQPWWVIPLGIGFVILVIGVIVSLFKSGRSGWGWALIVFIGLLIWWTMRNAGSGIAGGGSGGGGGATGSW